LELQIRILHLTIQFHDTDTLKQIASTHTQNNNEFASKMAIRNAFRQTKNFCNRHNSTDGYRINGTELWVMTSCTVEVGGSRTRITYGSQH